MGQRYDFQPGCLGHRRYGIPESYYGIFWLCGLEHPAQEIRSGIVALVRIYYADCGRRIRRVGVGGANYN